ncbi:MAG: hypothetical protein JJE29_05890 [Peptostreptococcaceae bacterium]|nr:hypothetical protein [Peptostreptococcaceae bacterium]
MKRYGLIFTVICLAQLLTGCFFAGAGSPGDLMEPPSLGANKQTIKEFVDYELLKDEILYKPGNPESLGAINFVDLDGDENEEAVVYFKDAANYRLGAYIFGKADGKWKVVDKIESSGVDISYSGFYDLTGNGKKEIVMAWSADKLDIFLNKYMIVYGYGENAGELYRDTYTEMVVGDFDRNSGEELLLLNLDRNVSEPSSEAKLVAFSGDGFRVMDEIELDPYINGYYNVAFGYAVNGKRGVFLDMGIGAHSAATYLLVVEDGILQNALGGGDSSYYGNTFKPYSVKSMDINGDGIIEIGTCEEPYGNDYSLADTLWITSWHQWDGEDGLKLVLKSYIDQDNDLRIDFPYKWFEGVSVRNLEENPEAVEIGYVDEKREIVYPMYRVEIIKESMLEERTMSFESEYFTAMRKNGKAYVVEKTYQNQNIPDDIKRGYTDAVLDDDEMKELIKTWR